jgi:hypothetical protein
MVTWQGFVMGMMAGFLLRTIFHAVIDVVADLVHPEKEDKQP